MPLDRSRVVFAGIVTFELAIPLLVFLLSIAKAPGLSEWTNWFSDPHLSRLEEGYDRRQTVLGAGKQDAFPMVASSFSRTTTDGGSEYWLDLELSDNVECKPLATRRCEHLADKLVETVLDRFPLVDELTGIDLVMTKTVAGATLVQHRDRLTILQWRQRLDALRRAGPFSAPRGTPVHAARRVPSLR